MVNALIFTKFGLDLVFFPFKFAVLDSQIVNAFLAASRDIGELIIAPLSIICNTNFVVSPAVF